jgi:HSP20 family protein
MNAEFDRLFGGWPAFPSLDLERDLKWMPKIDVVEKDGALVTRVDLPGMNKEDVSVEVNDGCLTLSGERKRESEEKKDDVVVRSEREYGSFYRSVPLPEGIKAEDIKASFTDGVLEVRVPLPPRQEAKATRIKIDEPARATSAS